ncbi:SCO family protein [Rhizobium leguminosarum]|uniref:SCO family protein n=1 Tax=Rhizobium leguminosarum TaxID=384 RepID=UPI003ECE9CE5
MVGLSQLQMLAGEINRAAESCAPGEALSRYFADNDPIYSGLSSADVDRVRAYAFAAVARTAPQSGVDAAREEILTGSAPGPLAGAARVIAALDAPSLDWLAPLASAARRLRGRDQKVWFDRIDSGIRSDISETGMTELARAFQTVARKNRVGVLECNEWIASAPDRFADAVRQDLAGQDVGAGTAQSDGCCCNGTAKTAPTPSRTIPPDIWQVIVEDQDETKATLGSRLLGRPSLLAFFYTRCMNPLKCSRTVTVLSETAQLAAAQGLAVGIYAMTYDPLWDTPSRLKGYGRDRGMTFSADLALMRTIADWDDLRAAFSLAVGYGPATVNRHQIEVLVLDPSGNVVFDSDGKPTEATHLVGLLKKAADAAGRVRSD